MIYHSKCAKSALNQFILLQNFTNNSWSHHAILHVSTEHMLVKLFCNFAFFCGDFLPVFESFWYGASFFSVFLWFLSLIVHVRLVWYLYFCSRKIKWFYLILLSPLPNDFCRFYICLRLQHFCRFENLIYKFCLDLDDFFSPYCNKAFLNF